MEVKGAEVGPVGLVRLFATSRAIVSDPKNDGSKLKYSYEYHSIYWKDDVMIRSERHQTVHGLYAGERTGGSVYPGARTLDPAEGISE
jgi:hypothetical protein